MKMYNVYNHYDTSKRIIGHVKPRWGQYGLEITPRTYNRLLDARVIGGDAGIYTDADEPIYVVSPKTCRVITIIGA